MIAPHAGADGIGPLTPLAAECMAAECMAVVVEAHIEAQLLNIATFVGLHFDGLGGYFQIWTLKRAIPGHCEGSTVARQTLLDYLFPAAPVAPQPNYGATQVQGKPADFAAVETPGRDIA